MALYLVTGGAGFIGSHLCDALLARGHRVRVLDDLSTGKRDNLDPRCELLVGDVADRAAAQRAAQGVAGVFHLAAIASVQRSNEDWLGTHRTNLSGTIAVLEAARDAGRVPVLYASSAAIYGDQGQAAITEAATPQPSTAYGADKLGSELHAHIGFGVHGVPTLGCRFFNVFGPRQDPKSPYSGVISIFAARFAAGQGVTIHGDGGQTRDFVYVGDVVAHLLAGMALLERAPQAAVFNVCTGRATSVLELAQALAALHGRPAALSFAPGRAGDIRTSLGSPAAASKALGVRAGMRLDEGLRMTCASLAEDLAHAA